MKELLRYVILIFSLGLPSFRTQNASDKKNAHAMALSQERKKNRRKRKRQKRIEKKIIHSRRPIAHARYKSTRPQDTRFSNQMKLRRMYRNC